MRKLKYAEVAVLREEWWHKQGKRCALTQRPLALEDAVLDHCHATGVCRGVLHRGANALLGKVENNYKRYGVQPLDSFLHGAAAYLQKHAFPPADPILHPTFKTPDEKREARNAKARKTRAARKAA